MLGVMRIMTNHGNKSGPTSNPGMTRTTLPALGQLPLYHLRQAKWHVEGVTDTRFSKTGIRHPLLQSPREQSPSPEVSLEHAL